MYCSHCGTEIPEGVSACPGCHASVTSAPAEAAAPAEKKKFFNEPSKKSKSFAAIFTALLVFPATLSVAIDLSFTRTTWAGYVVGAMLVIWVCTVLPALKITPAPVTAIICFMAIVGYVFFIIQKIGIATWLYQAFLPMFVLAAALFAAAVALISSKTVKGLHIFSLLSAEAVIYLVALEATLDNFRHGFVDLRWSLIISCAFISVIAVFEAFSYIGRINKK